MSASSRPAPADSHSTPAPSHEPARQGSGQRTDAEFRAAFDEVSIVDAHRLRGRLNKLARGDKRQSRDQLADDLAAAQRRVAARRATLPALRFPVELPVSAARDEIAQAIATHQVVVIAGETGSGKTTQLPKICLELGRGIRGSIGHTQPRRIAASSVARRIADETGTELGDTIGYSVRFSDRTGADTLVKVMTDGILLREIATDPMLRRYDTLIIDEAHERSLNIDFILGYLRQLLPRRPDLKVIITSATIEPDRFARHFGTDEAPAPVIEVSGRTYPVEVRYRPLSGDDTDTDLEQIQGIDAAVSELWSQGPGDILVFLPTERDIRDTADALRRRTSSGAEIVPLFARLSIAEQQKVFSPSQGRRIVLATNVAETSLTVPGIRYVIDTGTARISRYSTRTKVQRLPIEPVSQASAAQRAGRCGRVGPGICIRLFSEEDFESRPEFTDPEILRSNLASVILQMASLRLGDIAEFPFVQPPDHRAIRDGLAVLTELGAIAPVPAKSDEAHTPTLTAVGRTMSRIPVDPRIARMLVAGHEFGCLDHVAIIAAALSVPDVRERPAEHREAADTAHRRFAVPESDFLGYLQLWEYLTEQRKELSNNQFRRQCGREYLHYLRIREWQDLHRQLVRVIRDLDWVSTHTDRNADAIHRAILSGLLGNIAVRKTADSKSGGREYLGTRNTTVLIFPGSAVAKKPPSFLMAAEMIETSRLFAHTVAAIDPAWAERLAGDLVSRSYSEPHWSSKRGAAMAYEKVTLYGVTLVAKRRINLGPIDPAVARELFIRHALVQGEWRTNHAFYRHNADLLASATDIEDRTRRSDVAITDDRLFEFYDARVGAEVTSSRHFDTWWKKARRTQPDLLDLHIADVIDDAQAAPQDFPPAWQQGDARLELRYRFAPGTPDDGVTVVIPQPLLPHLRPAGFDWLVPGLRSELATELIRTLPKHIRRTMAPAQRFADLALSRLTPRAEPLTVGLARELSTITGSTIAAAEFTVDKLPPHLRMNFAVVDDSGEVVNLAKSLSELTGAVRTKQQGAQRATYSTWTTEGIGTLAESRSETVAGQTLTRYPTLRATTDNRAVSVVGAADPAARDRGILAGVIVLLDRNVPPLTKKIAASLTPQQRLALSQNPYASIDELAADCTKRALRDVLATEDSVAAVRSPADFVELASRLTPRITAAAPDYFLLAVAALTESAPLRREIDAHAGSDAADDVREQLDHLLFDGFVLHSPRTHLERLPRYLQAATYRLRQLPGAAVRDDEAMASLDRVIARWAQRLDQVSEPRRDHVNEQAHWLVEELRVGLFAQRLGTAYPVSEKRALRTLDRLG